MKQVSSRLLLLVSVIVVLGAVWQKLHIGIMIHLNGWQGLLFLGIGIIALFLLLDHLLNG